MASSSSSSSYYFVFSVVIASLLLLATTSVATTRKLTALVQQQPLKLNYHNGHLLMGNLTLNIVWYGNFTPPQRSIILDFLRSLTSPTAAPPPPPRTVAAWWKTTEGYKGGGKSALLLGTQILDQHYSLGKLLKSPQLQLLASRSAKKKSGTNSNGVINLVLTSSDVAVDGFCRSRCGTHGSTNSKSRTTFAWVGNSVSQCPGQCAWPFHQPIYGPQTPPLVAPNGDVGVDGMVINLATVLAGTVTNPFADGYFQGPADAPLEAVSACTGIFGKGAYPGYPGAVLVDKTTGASYNAVGIGGRKYLLPAMWDPRTSTCTTLV